ncbi:MAG: CHAD domain-containing protein [Bacteroidales bacterium]|nr:CHAD domain-containing protein [Bacteroidales bacterium]
MKNSDCEYILSQIYKDAVNLFLLNVDLCLDLEEDHIHQLRVGIKNLRAILVLVKVIKGKEFKKKKLSVIISKIFKPAGELRNIQIETMILGQYDSIETQIYKNHLAEIEEKNGIYTKTALIEFNKKDFDLKNEKAKQIIETINNEDLCLGIEKLISNEFNKIIQIRNELENIKALHEIRKHLKVLKSILKIKLVVNQDETTEVLLQQINSTETLIGDWHDKKLLTDSIIQFIENNNIEPNINLLKNLIEKIKIENKTALKKIIFNLNEIFSGNNL